MSDYTAKYNIKCMALGICRDCGKPKEPARMELTLCKTCANKRTIKARKSSIKKGVNTRHWIPISKGIYPRDKVSEVLVTDTERKVYALEKGEDEFWDEVMAEGILAWRGFPESYKGGK